MPHQKHPSETDATGAGATPLDPSLLGGHGRTTRRSALQSHEEERKKRPASHPGTWTGWLKVAARMEARALKQGKRSLLTQAQKLVSGMVQVSELLRTFMLSLKDDPEEPNVSAHVENVGQRLDVGRTAVHNWLKWLQLDVNTLLRAAAVVLAARGAQREDQFDDELSHLISQSDRLHELLDAVLQAAKEKPDTGRGTRPPR